MIFGFSPYNLWSGKNVRRQGALHGKHFPKHFGREDMRRARLLDYFRGHPHSI